MLKQNTYGYVYVVCMHAKNINWLADMSIYITVT